MSGECNSFGRRWLVELDNAPLSPDADSELDVPDRRDGRVYDYDDETHLAVEVALATGRPLLLRGDPGSGKSSLAAFVARNSVGGTSNTLSVRRSVPRTCSGGTTPSVVCPTRRSADPGTCR